MSLAVNLNAQTYYDENSDKEYEIGPQTNKKVLKAYLRQFECKDIEFNPNKDSNFPFRMKNNKGNWVLFDVREESVFMEKEGKNYSFNLPDPITESSGFTLANRNEKIYFIQIHGNGKILTKMSFEEVIPRLITDTLMFENADGKLEETYENHIASFTVKEGDKWGLIELANDNIYLSRNFLYQSSEEVPAETGFQSYQLEMMENLRKNHKIDLLIALDKYGYYFKARNKKTKLYGLYTGEGMLLNHIPAKYDDIIRHRNPETYEVWKDEKVGYYNGNYQLVFEPHFDDFKFVHLDYTFGCALKKNGKWELYKPNEPIKLLEGSAETIDELIELWLNR